MKSRKILRRVLLVLASLLALIIIVFALAIYWIVTPARVTPMVNDIAGRYITTPFEIGRVDVSIFEDFPNVSLVIDSLRVEQNADSLPPLLDAGRCVVSINPFALLSNKIKINQLQLSDVDINLYHDSLVAPIQVFRFETPDDVDTVQSASASYDLSVHGVELRGANILIDDRLKDFYSSVDSISMELDMEADSTGLDFDLTASFPHISLRRQGENLSSDDALSVSSRMTFSRDSLLLRIVSAQLAINQIQMQTHGTIAIDSSLKCLYPTLEASLTTPSIDEFVRLVPSWLLDHKEKLQSKGAINLAVNIMGEYSADSVPRVNGGLSIENGMMKFDGRPLSVDDLDVDLEAYIDPNAGGDSYVVIKDFSMRSSDVMDVKSSGVVRNVLGDASFNVHMRSDINFSRLVELFPLAQGIELSGENRNDFQANFSLSHIMKQNYGNIFLDGSSSFSGVNFSFDRAGYLGDSTAKGALRLDIDKGEMKFGDDSLSSGAQKRQLRARMNFTDFALETRHGEHLEVRNLYLALGANLDRKTQAVTGVGGLLTMDDIDCGLRSNLQVSSKKNKIRITMLPIRENAPAHIQAQVDADSLQAIDKQTNSALTLEGVSSTVELSRSSKTEKWGIKAGVNFDEFIIFSSMFPTFITVKDSHLNLEDRTIFLRNTNIRAGQSSLVATGSITNMISTLLGENPEGLPMTGNLAISSQLLDMGELIDITNESVMFAQNQTKNQTKNQNAAQNTVQDQVQNQLQLQDSSTHENLHRIDSTAEQDILPLVPENVNFDLTLDVLKVVNGDDVYENFQGRAIINKGVLSLKGLRMNALGAQIDCDMIYNNLDTRRANLYIDAHFRGLQIAQLGHVSASIDSMMPMLKDFSGEVDMNLRARTIIGVESFDPVAIGAAADIRGRDLVLMDSETFTSLSKMLMFKNKKRNLIDSLQVKIIMDSSKIKVLPFPISIDRYRAVVGGEQTVDNQFNLDYNYNISILKSPLPFKAGVDIFGNLDDYDFDITRAKLKHADFAALDSVFVRFRNSIKPVPRK